MAGLHIYRSNRVEVLAEVLASLMEDPTKRPANPTIPIEIGVGSRGMERWLRHRLATRMGICANIGFPFPASMISDIITRLIGDASPENTWNEQRVLWRILDVLPALITKAHPAVQPLASYLQGGPAQTISSRELALAIQIAQVFDRYALYRPLLSRSWSGALVADPPNVPDGLQWQQALWRRMSQGGGFAPSPAERIEAARHALATHAPECDTLAKVPIRLFGISTMPPIWLELLSDVARHVDVELFIPCTSIHAWDGLRDRPVESKTYRKMDRVTEVPEALAIALHEHIDHPLIQSLGRSGLDMAIVLDSLARRADFTVAVDTTATENPSSGHTILAQLQSDLLRGRSRQRRFVMSKTDSSIRFHACPGSARQVEVLRDVILDILDRDASLEPRDILVMTPDIDKYATLLTGAFSGSTTGPNIGISISDRSARRTNPVLDALLRLLEMATNRVTASATLELLALEPVAARFECSPDDVAQIRTWIVDSGFRWGIDADERAAADQPSDPHNTLEFAADRLALGVVMADEGQAITLGKANPLTPFDPVEGSTTAIAGRFLEFAENLSQEIRQLRKPRTVIAWVRQILGDENAPGVIARLTATTGNQAWLTQQARDTLTAMASAASDVARPLSLDAFYHLLGERTERIQANSRAHSGTITACAFMPMRAVPYPVICLLGMDEGTFPRSAARPGFDWTQLAPRVGDPIAPDEDRQVFLETIMSTRAHLEVLYTGRDERTNEPATPCVPVGELLEVLDSQFEGPNGEKPSALLTRTHPLQAYSKQCFQRDAIETGISWSFDANLCTAAQRTLAPRRQPVFISGSSDQVNAPPMEISIDELAAFFDHPSRALLQQRFGIGQEWTSPVLSDHLPSALSPGTTRRLGRALLNRTLQAHRNGTNTLDYLDWAQHLQGLGTLPSGRTAANLLHEPIAIVRAVTQRCAPLLSSPQTDFDVRIPIQTGQDSISLTGHVSEIQGNTLTRYFWGGGGTSSRRWWIPRAWIELLAWAVATESNNARLCTVHAGSSGSDASVSFRCYSPPLHPRRMLTWMVRKYIDGLRVPMPFFPLSSGTFAWQLRPDRRGAKSQVPVTAAHFEGEALEPGQDDDIAFATSRALAMWGTLDGGGDAADPFVRRLFGDSNPLKSTDGSVNPGFANLALGFWGPVFAGRKTAKVPPSIEVLG